MLSKHYEVFDFYTILFRLQVILLDQHQNIDFVQSQLEVLSLGLDNLHSHILFVFMIISLHYVTKRPATKPLYKLIPEADMIMLIPQVVALEIILIAPASSFIF